MKSIFVHISPNRLPFKEELNSSNYTFTEMPEYASVSIDRCRELLSEEPIVITDDIIEAEFTEDVKEFFLLCKTGFPSFYRDTFWLLTLLRLYVVYLYCKKYNITEFVHLEYDNLIYTDLVILKKLPPLIYFTRVGPYCSSAGFVYCNSFSSFHKFIEKLKSLIFKTENHVKHFTKYDHLSEMILIDLIHTHTKNIMSYLPILPDGIGSDNFNILGVLFDGASYGQYIGGTNNGDKPGWYGMHHYVGQSIHNKDIEVVFNSVPLIKKNNNSIIPIMNLHIHSKQLKNYV